MTPELETAIEAMYETFSGYPLNPEIDGCPCCVSDLHFEEYAPAGLRIGRGDFIAVRGKKSPLFIPQNLGVLPAIPLF